jgi:hypothetical protein
MSKCWQPIETVPKDGRAVILCWASDADGVSIDWTKNAETAGVFVQVASWREYEDFSDWTVYADRVSDLILHFSPTHWMPLPLPPCREAKP